MSHRREVVDDDGEPLPARQAGRRDFHFHDLRHHGATMALNRGFTAPIVMALGGWKTERHDAALRRGHGRDASDALLRPSLVTRSLPRWPENDHAVRDVVSTTL